MRTRLPLAAVIVLVVALAAALAGGFVLGREPRLPAVARAALSAAVGTGGDGQRGLRLLEVERIGPDFAVIYLLGRSPGAALLVDEGSTWSVEGAPDPGALMPARSTGIGSTTLTADGLQIVFLGIPDRRVARLAVRFPADGTVLNAQRKGRYVIVWRAAAAGSLSYLVESFDRAGRRLAP